MYQLIYKSLKILRFSKKEQQNLVAQLAFRRRWMNRSRWVYVWTDQPRRQLNHLVTNPDNSLNYKKSCRLLSYRFQQS